MGTEILKSFSHLQNELEEARNSLKGVDENIKRLIGRAPNEMPPRPGQKRPVDDKISRQPFNKFSNRDDQPNKRRNFNNVSVFKRLSEKVPDEDVKAPSRGLISKVIAAPKEVPSRQAVLDKQNKDEKFKARNRRMFGALIGTLQRFQQEESKSKKREEKRTQIEKKIEEHEQQEKAEIKKERQELFMNRKKKQQEIKMIELKMLRMKEYAAWEASQKPRSNFITTKAKPHIHYLPRKVNDKIKELLEKSKKDVEEQIEKRKQAVCEELTHIEDRMKRNFEPRSNPEVKEQEKTSDWHDRHGSESEMDDDMDLKPKSPSPDPKDEAEDIELLQKPEDQSTATEDSAQLHQTTDLCDNGVSEIDVQSQEVTVDNLENINIETDVSMVNVPEVHSEEVLAREIQENDEENI